MIRAISSCLFRYGLLGFPSDFRRAYSEEMLAVFSARCSAKTGMRKIGFTLDETVGAFASGLRMRIADSALTHPAFATAIAVAMMATTLVIHEASPSLESRIQFSGHDPAGAFTITIVDGKPVAATMNNISLSKRRIVHRADSIRILASSGEVALAVAFDRATSSITWQPRPP